MEPKQEADPAVFAEHQAKQAAQLDKAQQAGTGPVVHGKPVHEAGHMAQQQQHQHGAVADVTPDAILQESSFRGWHTSEQPPAAASSGELHKASTQTTGSPQKLRTSHTSQHQSRTGDAMDIDAPGYPQAASFAAGAAGAASVGVSGDAATVNGDPQGSDPVTDAVAAAVDVQAAAGDDDQVTEPVEDDGNDDVVDCEATADPQHAQQQAALAEAQHHNTDDGAGADDDDDDDDGNDNDDGSCDAGDGGANQGDEVEHQDASVQHVASKATGAESDAYQQVKGQQSVHGADTTPHSGVRQPLISPHVVKCDVSDGAVADSEEWQE